MVVPVYRGMRPAACSLRPVARPHFDHGRVAAPSSSTGMIRPGRFVLEIRLRLTSWSQRRAPPVMSDVQNKPMLILFHVPRPGGRPNVPGHTSFTASSCRATFRDGTGCRCCPPPSCGDQKRSAPRSRLEPILFHQRWIASRANRAAYHDRCHAAPALDCPSRRRRHRGSLAAFLVQESGRVLLRLTARLPLSPVLNPDQSFLRSRDHGVGRASGGFSQRVDVLEMAFRSEDRPLLAYGCLCRPVTGGPQHRPDGGGDG